MRWLSIFAIPNGEYPAGASGSPSVRSAWSDGPTYTLRGQLDLKTDSDFKGLLTRSNSGGTHAEPTRNAATDVTRVVLKACIDSSSRGRSKSQESGSSSVRFGEGTDDRIPAIHSEPSTPGREKPGRNYV